MEEVCSSWESQAERAKGGNCLVTELHEAGICRAEKDMERHKLQPGLLFQSTKLLLSRLSSNEPIMCGFGLLKMYVTF